jgi:hypothetical protein
MPRAKRPPGSRRAREKRRQARQAARSTDYEAKRAEALHSACGELPTTPVATFGWLGRLLVHEIWDAANDVGLPPEARREQVARLAPQLVKACEPARLSVKLEEYERTIDELRQRLKERSAGAAAFDPAAPGSTRSPASIS